MIARTDPHCPPMMKVVLDVVAAAGQGGSLATAPAFHLRVPNPPFMALVIESFRAPDPLHGEARWVSVAHYRMENGDPCPDPEIVMDDQGYPLELQQVPVFIRGLGGTSGLTRICWRDEDSGKVLVNPRAKRSVESFLRLWASNIRKQGFIAAASAQAAAAAMQAIQERGA